MVHDQKNIDQIKKSIKKFNEYSQKEKESLWIQLKCFGLMQAFKRKSKT